MNPQTFARAVVSIESKYGLRLDAAEVWSRLDGAKCGKGWEGTKPGCERAGKKDLARSGLSSGDKSSNRQKNSTVAEVELGRSAIGRKILDRLDAAIAPEIRVETDEIKRLRESFDKVFDKDPVGSWDSPESKALTAAEIKTYGVRQTALAVMEELRMDLFQMSKREAEKLSKRVETMKSVSKNESEIRDHLIEFIQFTGGKSAETFKAIKIDSSRAYADVEKGVVNMGRESSPDSRKKVLFHEFGHILEVRGGLSSATRKWLDHRATGSAVPLNKLSKLSEYDKDEMARPGNFIDPYVGKEYGGPYTEVLSMGLERMVSAKTMLSFYQADKEHFLLTVGVTRK